MMNKLFGFETSKFMLLALMAAVVFWQVIHNLGGLYAQNDAYYYLSIADTWWQTGQFRDSTSIPTEPVVTPQNGIVFLLIFVKWLGIETPISQLNVMAAINYGFFTLFCFLIYKIYQLFRVDRHSAFILTASIAVSISYVRVFFQSINDAIFNAMAMLALYLILREKKDWKIYFVLFLIGSILSEFRLTGILIFISAAIVYWACKKYRSALVFTGMAIFSFAVQLLLLRVFVTDQSSINKYSRLTVEHYSYSSFRDNFIHTITSILPEGWLSIERDYAVSLPAIAGVLISCLIIFSFWRLLKQEYRQTERDEKQTLIVLYVLLYFCSIQLLWAPITRYILAVAPFLTLLLFLSILQAENHRRIMAYFLFISSIAITVIIPPDDAFSAEGLSKRVVYQELRPTLESLDYDLVSESNTYARVNYFLLNKPSHSYIEQTKKNKILIIGHSPFVDMVKRELAKARGREIELQHLKSYRGYFNSGEITISLATIL